MQVGRLVRLVSVGLCLALLGIGQPRSVAAAEPEIYTGLFSKLAVGGYDPVAYFKGGAPAEGSDRFTLDYKGATWRFASAENLAAFRTEPEKYAPQYGGYCAWAVAQGKTAKGDPLYWRIVGGKHYLNYNADVQKRWEADIPALVKAADGNWPKVVK